LIYIVQWNRQVHRRNPNLGRIVADLDLCLNTLGRRVVP
jgi:hypothetical protein